MRYALIDSSGIVENVIECDESFQAPDGFTLVQSDEANIGDTYAQEIFTKLA